MKMLEIKVLGTNCPKCEQLLNTTKQAIEELALEATVEKISDIQTIIGYGIMRTPALVVNGQEKMYGQVPSLEELKNMIISTS